PLPISSGSPSSRSSRACSAPAGSASTSCLGTWAWTKRPNSMTRRLYQLARRTDKQRCGRDGLPWLASRPVGAPSGRIALAGAHQLHLQRGHGGGCSATTSDWLPRRRSRRPLRPPRGVRTRLRSFLAASPPVDTWSSNHAVPYGYRANLTAISAARRLTRGSEYRLPARVRSPGSPPSRRDGSLSSDRRCRAAWRVPAASSELALRRQDPVAAQEVGRLEPLRIGIVREHRATALDRVDDRAHCGALQCRTPVAASEAARFGDHGGIDVV